MKSIVLIFTVTFLCITCHKETPGTITPIPDDNFTLEIEAGVHEYSFTTGGVERRFLVQAPSDFQKSKTYPVVFALKGKSESAGRWVSDLNDAIENRQYIGVYPESLNDEWMVSGLTDVEFISKVVGLMQTTGNIQTSRMYCLGISNGGVMAYYMATQTNHFAAVTSMSGSLYHGIKWPPSGKPVSILQIHGQLDQSVPYNGGSTHGYVFYSAPESVDKWADTNGCNGIPETSTLPGAVVYSYDGCSAGVETLLFSVPGANHAVYSDYKGIDLNGYIFDFFGRHNKNGT